MKNTVVAFTLSASLSLCACATEVDEKPSGANNAVKGAVTGQEWYKAGADAVAASKALVINKNKAKNVILFIGDGMGISTLTAARILEGQVRGEAGEENLLSFEKFPYTAIVKTYNTDLQVSDSAGTATAMNTGMKTRGGIISLNPSQPRSQCAGASDNVVQTLAERLEGEGYATGIVTTTRITHATPASVYAHSAERYWENDAKLPAEAVKNGCKDIAAQFAEFSVGNGIDITLGGGRSYFLPQTEGGARKDGRNLIDEWKKGEAKANYVSNKAELDTVTSSNSSRVLGLFNDDHLKFESDRGDSEPSLTEMTEKAITFLEGKDNGYYLMVEAGRVDHAHHGGNAYRALHDTVELSAAVRRTMEMVDLNETLILVTADHSHTFTIGGRSSGFTQRGNPIFGLVENKEKGISKDDDGKPYTTLSYSHGGGHIAGERPDLTNEITQAKDYRQETVVPLKSESHGGEDVALFAIGPWSHLVRGTIEQNVIYHYMVNALGLDEKNSK